MESRETIELDTSPAYVLAVARHVPPARDLTEDHVARQSLARGDPCVYVLASGHDVL
jgi:hypothetical protein